jgi:DNA-binding PadR family transcriptional regulator
MSKAHMVVLSFIGGTPMHGYQIGQMVDQFCLPRLAGITLPAIYKAIQTLEKNKYIRGEEMREGNNPPRMVFHLNPKGEKYLKEIVRGYLNDNKKPGPEWWFTLMFAKQALTKTELLELIKKRIVCIEEIGHLKKDKKEFLWTFNQDQIPFIHKHLMILGDSYAKAELQALKNLYEDITGEDHNEFFLPEGDLK